MENFEPCYRQITLVDVEEFVDALQQCGIEFESDSLLTAKQPEGKIIGTIEIDTGKRTQWPNCDKESKITIEVPVWGNIGGTEYCIVWDSEKWREESNLKWNNVWKIIKNVKWKIGG